jgi:hypothetical protein
MLKEGEGRSEMEDRREEEKREQRKRCGTAAPVGEKLFEIIGTA